MPGHGEQFEQRLSSLQELGRKDALNTGMREEGSQEGLTREAMEMKTVPFSR